MTVEAAGEVYLWLSAALDVPDEALLTVEFAELGRDGARALSPSVELPEADAFRTACADRRPPADDRLRALQREHARLFIGPPRAVIRPYESCCLGGDQLMADCALAVRAFYADAGIGFDGAICQDAPDHVAVELNALALLCLGRTGQPVAERERLERAFLEAHLGRWGQAFAARLLEATREPLYRAAAELLDCVLAVRRPAELNRPPGP